MTLVPATSSFYPSCFRESGGEGSLSSRSQCCQISICTIYQNEKIYQITIKYTHQIYQKTVKWTYIIAIKYRYQHLPLQGLQNFTKIGIFGLKICYLATLVVLRV
jgi:hypothetical protein